MGSSSHDNVVDSVAARYVGHDMFLNGSYGANAGTTGFQIAGTNNTIKNTAISFSSGNGLAISGTGHTVDNCIVHDVDYATTECAGISLTSSSRHTAFGQLPFSSCFHSSHWRR